METFPEFIYTRAITKFCTFFQVHINQYWYFQGVITQLCIFFSSYKPLLTNKTIKMFSQFIMNNINIYRELLSNNTGFYRLGTNSCFALCKLWSIFCWLRNDSVRLSQILWSKHFLFLNYYILQTDKIGRNIKQ